MAAQLSMVPIGRTALQVSRIGLGSAPMGRLDQPAAVATLRAALEGGIRFFDTAPLYGAGLSEEHFGAVLPHVPRDSFVLSTKVGRLIKPDGTISFEYSRDAVLRSIEESLQRLKLDRIDILLIHDPDNHYQEALNEAFPTLADLRSQGVIGAIGAGMNQWQMEADFVRNADPDCFLLAGRYTLLEQGSLEFLELCRQRNIGVFLGGVFNSGILAAGAQSGATYNYSEPPAAIKERVAQIEAVCKRHNVPLHVAAVQFAAAHPAVTALLLGAVAPAEVQANLEALAAPTPAAFWAELRAEGLVDQQAPLPSDGR